MLWVSDPSAPETQYSALCTRLRIETVHEKKFPVRMSTCVPVAMVAPDTSVMVEPVVWNPSRCVPVSRMNSMIWTIEVNRSPVIGFLMPDGLDRTFPL
jgi:hypothetical protein